MITNYRNPWPPLVTPEDLNRGRTEMRRLYVTLAVAAAAFVLVVTLQNMKELIELYTEAWQEAKQNPLEALGTLVTFITMCGLLYALSIVLWAISG